MGLGKVDIQHTFWGLPEQNVEINRTKTQNSNLSPCMFVSELLRDMI